MTTTDPARKKEIARDLDSYLTQRRKSDGTEVPVEHKKRIAVEEVSVSQSEAHELISSADSLDDDYPSSHKSWFSTLFERFFSGDEEDMHETHANHSVSPDAESKTKQDMRELAQISLAVIKQLPDSTLQEFKESTQFHRFKEILRKYEIIK